MWVLNNLNIKYAKISKCRGHAFMQYKIPLLIQIFLPMHLYNSSYANSKNYQSLTYFIWLTMVHKILIFPSNINIIYLLITIASCILYYSGIEGIATTKGLLNAFRIINFFFYFIIIVSPKGPTVESKGIDKLFSYQNTTNLINYTKLNP